MPKRHTRAQVRAIVERFHRSGLSQRAFAEQIDLSKNTLAFWIARERVRRACELELLGTPALGVRGDAGHGRRRT